MIRTIETSAGPITIRELSTPEDMVASETIQFKVWGSDIIAHPKEMMIPVQHEGGLLAGAFAPGGEMVGFIFAFPTRDPQIMHSQMLATLEEWRGHGIGRELKWYQRSWSLEQGVKLVRWTVDPLRAANAELNIRHLGAVSSTYSREYYGVMPGIDAGAPSDRLLAEWHLDSDRVRLRAETVPADRGFANAPRVCALSDGKPVDLVFDSQLPRILLPLPDHYIRMSQTDVEAALEWRLRTRELFEFYFSNGYSITEFTRMGGPAYLLEKNA